MYLRRGSLVVVALLWGTLSAAAPPPVKGDAAPPSREEVDALRKRIEELENNLRKQEGGKTPAAATTTPPAPSPAMGILANVLDEFKRKTDTHLYATFDYLKFEGRRSRFEAKNVELVMNVEPYPGLSIGTELDFEGAGGDDEGSGQKVEVEQGWMKVRFVDALALRGGILLVPFGHYNLNHFDSQQEFVAVPLMARHVVPTTWPEAGVGLAGTVYHLFGQTTLYYDFYALNGLDNRLSNTTTRGAPGAFSSDNNGNKAAVGRVELTMPRGTRFALSGYYGDYDSRSHAISGVDADFGLPLGPVELVGEYAFFAVERGLSDEKELVPSSYQGGYAELRYRFWPTLLENSWLARRWPESRLTVGVRAGFTEIDPRAPKSGNNRERRVSFAFNYRPVPSLAMKAEYQVNNGSNESIEHGDRDGLLLSLAASF